MYQQPSETRIQPLANDFDINKPTPGQALLAIATAAAPTVLDKVKVQITKTLNGDSFWAKIFDASVAPADRIAEFPATALPTMGPVALGGPVGAQYQGDLPVGVLPTAPPNRNNKVVVVAAYNTNNRLSMASVGFMLMPRQFEIKVDAKCCVWMTFAPEGTTNAPYGETVPGYRPIPLALPDNANQVVLAANNTNADKWRHDPADSAESDAGGRTTEKRKLEKPAYYRDNAALYARNFVHENGGDLTSDANAIELNKLIAFWDYGPENINRIIEVGKNKTISIPTGDPRPSFLQLAFHDGYEWSNNRGSVTVKVTWSDA